MTLRTGSWTDLGAGIRVRQSALYAMNSVVLHHPEHTVLVDPGILPSELDDLSQALGRQPPSRITLVFTHGDWDHVLGRPWWPHASTLGHDRLASELKANGALIRAEAERAAHDAGQGFAESFRPFRPRLEVSGLHFGKLAPWRIVFRDAFGHSPSMLSAHLPEHRLLIAGDMLSDCEIPLLQQSCDLYRRTLTELVTLAEGGAIQTLIPGHGTIARSQAEVLSRLQRDLHYLSELENRVSAAHAKGQSLESTLQSLGLRDCLGKDAPASMDEEHRKNIQRVFEGIAAASKTDSGSGARRRSVPTIRR